jgi:hypothetical protein
MSKKGAPLNAKLVVSQPDPPIEKPILAEAIVEISDGVTELLKSGVNHRAVVVLLRDQTGIAKRDIEHVLRALKSLKQDYCR